MKYEIMPSVTMTGLQSRVRELFHMAKICKWSHAELSTRICEQILEPIRYRTPSGKLRHSPYMQGYVMGLIDAEREDIWRNYVEFCYLVDGELYSTHLKTNRKTTQIFYDRGRGDILSDSPNSYYWLDSDKPF